MTEVLIPVDRSRRELDEKCPRARYYGYEYQGTGIERRALNQHLAFGLAVHDALATILEEVASKDAQPDSAFVVMAIESAIFRFREAFRQRGFAMEGAEGMEEDPYTGSFTMVKADFTWLCDHYCDLLEALVTGWCMVRLPSLLKDYRVLQVEKEKQLIIPIDATHALLFLSRPDALLERRSDLVKVILNFKTASETKGWWLERWQVDQQTISEVLPIEHETGEICGGVLIEGLVKGKQVIEYPKGSGHWQHGSPLVWAWRKEGDGFQPEEWAARYEWRDEEGNFRRLGKGWTRVRVFTDYPGGIPAWLNRLRDRDPDLLVGQFVSPPLVSRNAEALDEWKVQVQAREFDIYEAAKIAEVPGMNVLARDFPKHTHNANCLFPTKCAYYDICWGEIGDPLQSGLYQIRVPNHPEAVNG